MVGPVEVSWRRYGADGGQERRLPPPEVVVPVESNGRWWCPPEVRDALYHLSMRKLKGKGKGQADWPEIAAFWQDPMVLEAIQKDLMSAWTALNYRASR